MKTLAMKTLAALTASLLVLAASGAALADKEGKERKERTESSGRVQSGGQLTSTEARALVVKGELMPLDEILRRNESQIVGRIIDLHLERKRGDYIYDIKVLRPDGHYVQLEINARTGTPASGSK
jgi:uncharacterized membrane protein YkoI